MFAGVADYGMYLNADVAARKSSRRVICGGGRCNLDGASWAGRGYFFAAPLGQDGELGGSEKSHPSTSAAPVSDSSEATPARTDDHDNFLN